MLIINFSFFFLAHMVTRLDELHQRDFCHALPTLLVTVGFHQGLHSDVVLLAVKPKHLLNFTQTQVEALRYKAEESVG